MIVQPHSELLPVVRASELAKDEPEQLWLLHGLWSVGGVGVLAGHPKVGKSWMGLQMAVSVASGTPFLGRYEPVEPGPVLVYLAEDAHVVVRKRLEALCRHHGVSLPALDLFVITAPTLRIDVPREQERLWRTVASIRPRMLLLDPLVRLHAGDENRADDISAILAYLRALQRELQTAIVLVHHARKAASSTHPGLALRGSSDIHAFGDHNLYLRRTKQRLNLSIEHRAAPTPEPLDLELVSGETPHLRITDQPASSEATAGELTHAVTNLLEQADTPLTKARIRQNLRARNERVAQALLALETQGTIERTRQGWRLNAENGPRSPPKGSHGTGPMDNPR